MLFTLVMWHAQNCPIGGNKMNLILAPHFLLSEGGYVATSK